MSELRDKISEELYDTGVLDLGGRDYGFHHLRDFDRRHLDQVADRILALLPGTYENTAQHRESSPELSSLAAKYLGINEWEYNGRMADLSLRFEFFTDIKRLAASVLSQSGE